MWNTLDPGAPLDNTMGALLIGCVASGVLYGMTLVQAYYYFTLYSKDIPYLKMLVVILLITDGTHLSFTAHSVYYYLISNYYDPRKLGQVVWSMMGQMACMILSASLVQSYYAMRIWRFGKNHAFLLVITVLILFQFALGAGWVIVMLQTQSYVVLMRLRPLKITITVLSTIIDVVITTSLVILLRNSRTGFHKSDSSINKMIVFFVTTGIIPSIGAIGALISLTAFPGTLIYGSFAACIGELYTGSFIGALNARRSFMQQVDENSNMRCTSYEPTMFSTCVYTSTAYTSPVST